MIMFSSVEHLLYGPLPETEDNMEDILETFTIREQYEGQFLFGEYETTQPGDLSPKRGEPPGLLEEPAAGNDFK